MHSEDISIGPGRRVEGLISSNIENPYGLRPQERPHPFPPEMKLSAAAAEWLRLRVNYLAPRTVRSYRSQVGAVVLFFRDARLCDIDSEAIREYQTRRRAGLKPFKFRRTPLHINNEVRTLRHILTRANLWHLLADEYEEVPVEFAEPRRVMTKEEEAHLFKVASSLPEFAFVYAYSLLSVHTSASGAELRGLRLRDIDLIGQNIQINSQSAKNPYRVRTIPLVPAALSAANSLMIRARHLGSTEPWHFLMPYRRGNAPYNPCRQMADNGLMKRWHALREAAGMPWLTPHVLRYQCITKMAEANIDRITAKRIAGHITDNMWDKYSQVRIESTRKKLTEAFSGVGGAPAGLQELTIGAPAPAPAKGRSVSRDQPAKTSSIGLTDPAIQAEIARQVAAAVAQHEQRRSNSGDAIPPQPVKGPRG